MCTYQDTPALVNSQGCTRECTYQHTGICGVLTSILLPLYLSGLFSWVYLPAYSCPCTSRGVLVGLVPLVCVCVWGGGQWVGTYQHTLALVPLGGVCVCVGGGWVVVLTSILLPLYLSGVCVSVCGWVGQLTSILLSMYLSGLFSWVYLPAYSCPCTSRVFSWALYLWFVCVEGVGGGGVLTSILLPLYLSGLFSWVYLPAYSCPCTSRGCSRGCTYQHTPALVPLRAVLVGVLTSILLPLYLSGLFSWVYLPAYSCPCTSRGYSRECTYQHTPALVPLGGILVSVLTSILLPLYLSGLFSWVYLPAYSCPCTSRGCSRTLRDTRAAHVTHHTETHRASLNIHGYDTNQS